MLRIRQVQIVDQDPVLFHATLEENVRYARPDASAEAVQTAIRQASADFDRRLSEFGSTSGKLPEPLASIPAP